MRDNEWAERKGKLYVPKGTFVQVYFFMFLTHFITTRIFYAVTCFMLITI